MARPAIASRLLAAAALLLTAAPPAYAQPTETAVKAAFLTKFASYVEWPAAAHLGAGDPIILCIVGTDPFGRAIEDAARGQQVDGHPLAVRRIPGPDGADGCQLAFVGGQKIADLLAALRGKPVLTVTDGRSGPERGMIHFVIAQGRVRFDIDQAEAVRCGLILNARLLGVALNVKAAR